MKNRRKAVQPFEIKKRKIDIFRNYEANGFEKNQRKFENFSTLISKKSKPTQDYLIKCFQDALALFDKNYLIGSDEISEKSIREGLTLMISDGDFRRKPFDASSLLFS